MAIEFLSAAFKVQLASAEKFVLVALADTANDEGLAWPSLRFLTLKTGLSESTVRRTFATLEALGYISVERRHNSTSRYWLNLPALLAAKNPAWPQPKSYPQSRQADTPGKNTPCDGDTPPCDGDTPPPVMVTPPPVMVTGRSVSYPSSYPSNILRRSDALKSASPESEPELPPEVRAANLAKLRALVGLPPRQ